jgi:hypothetical protein
VPAIAAASAGDTIQIAAGTYGGGITIDKSLRLVGAGAQATTIEGGGPVVTIGTFGAGSEPTVSISGVTITDGVARSSPESTPFVGQEGVFALGGGVEIPPNADFSGGATVTIANSVITGNRATPSTAIAAGPFFACPPDITITCINGDLPFAQAGGGGIDSWGTLTLAHTTVSDNLVGSAAGLPSVTSLADGGAILNWLGPVTITDSRISGNRASATAPNGLSADTGGIFLEGGSLTMSGSSVTNNGASLSATMPSDVPEGTAAIAGGIHLSGGVSTGTISNSTISGNFVEMTNAVGDANAFSGGVHVDVGVGFALSNSTISDNSVTVMTLPGSSGNAAGDSAAGEMHGTITNTRLTGNSVSVSSVAGDANAGAGASIFTGTISNSLVGGNHLQASSPTGSASAPGGGLLADQGGMTLRNTTISGNTAEVSGQSALAQGGGIFDTPIPNGPPGGPLTLLNSSVTGNTLAGNAGALLQGGGLYIQSEPLTMTNSVIAQNVPDQCDGC